ncbi:MAG TPA: DUF1631 family protein, partial [Burkholderiaceae bacterium]|nr:DUF1631 family protein [Burkholderiaceae bacterium]
MSTATTAGSGKATRAASQRVIVWLRASMRKALEPLLPTAARDAIQVIDEDEQASATLKKSVRRLLVDQREFSSAFFTAVDREIDAAFEELYREGAEKQAQPQEKPEVRAGALSLVGYDQMEEKMMLDRFAARIRNAVNEHYSELTQLLAVALKVPGLG